LSIFRSAPPLVNTTSIWPPADCAGRVRLATPLASTLHGRMVPDPVRCAKHPPDPEGPGRIRLLVGAVSWMDTTVPGGPKFPKFVNSLCGVSGQVVPTVIGCSTTEAPVTRMVTGLPAGIIPAILQIWMAGDCCSSGRLRPKPPAGLSTPASRAGLPIASSPGSRSLGPASAGPLSPVSTASSRAAVRKMRDRILCMRLASPSPHMDDGSPQGPNESKRPALQPGLRGRGERAAPQPAREAPTVVHAPKASRCLGYQDLDSTAAPGAGNG
jgi:hypothetical protein